MQNLRAIAPKSIKVPENHQCNQEEVDRIVKVLKNKGSLPDITITSSNALVEGVDALFAAIACQQSSVLAIVQSATDGIKKVSTDLLYPHPLNEEIYGQENIDRLKESIKESGWVATVTVVQDGSKYRVISGISRLRACQELGINEMSVEVRHFNSPEEEIEALLKGNIGRETTLEQKAREAIKWEQIKPELAIAQKGKRKRDVIAQKAGFGNGVSCNQAIVAVKAMDQAKENGDHEKYDKLKKALSRRRQGVSAAYNIATEKETAPKKKNITVLEAAIALDNFSQEQLAEVFSFLPYEKKAQIKELIS